MSRKKKVFSRVDEGSRWVERYLEGVRGIPSEDLARPPLL